MAKADFYETLGVAKTADEKELKSAFRKLAMKFHPDKNPDDKDAERKFKEINEAYEMLKDPQKRAAYDRYGHVRLIRFEERFSSETAFRQLSGFDLLIDGSDNFDTRYAAADAAEEARLPLVSGAVGRFDGSLTVLKPYESAEDGTPNPRYRDLFPEAPPMGLIPACAEAGVIGALTGVIGTMMAMEAIKLVTGTGEPLIGRLLLYDALSARFDTVRYKRRRTTQRQAG